MGDSTGRGRGIWFYLVALTLFSTQDMIAKHLTSSYEPLMIVWVRYASQVFWTALIFSNRLRTYLKTRHIGLQLLRSALLFSATYCFFNSFKYLQLAESIAIFEIAPLLITALSVIVLKEQVGWRRWVGVAIGLLGALVIIRPGTDVFTIGALYPIGAALSFAGYTIATKFLSSDEPAMTTFVYTALIGTIFGTILLPPVWSTPASADIPLMLALGGIAGIGHFLLIRAFSDTDASVLAPFSYVGLPIAAFWGLVVFDEIPDRWTITGAVIIVGAGLFVWYRERQVDAR